MSKVVFAGPKQTQSASSLSPFLAGQSPEPCFNILVQKTEASAMSAQSRHAQAYAWEACSQAVGFSGRVAFRQHSKVCA